MNAYQKRKQRVLDGLIKGTFRPYKKNKKRRGSFQANISDNFSSKSGSERSTSSRNYHSEKDKSDYEYESSSDSSELISRLDSNYSDSSSGSLDSLDDENVSRFPLAKRRFFNLQHGIKKRKKLKKSPFSLQMDEIREEEMRERLERKQKNRNKKEGAKVKLSKSPKASEGEMSRKKKKKEKVKRKEKNPKTDIEKRIQELSKMELLRRSPSQLMFHGKKQEKSLIDRINKRAARLGLENKKEKKRRESLAGLSSLQKLRLESEIDDINKSDLSSSSSSDTASSDLNTSSSDQSGEGSSVASLNQLFPQLANSKPRQTIVFRRVTEEEQEEDKKSKAAVVARSAMRIKLQEVLRDFVLNKEKRAMFLKDNEAQKPSEAVKDINIKNLLFPDSPTRKATRTPPSERVQLSMQKGLKNMYEMVAPWTAPSEELVPAAAKAYIQTSPRNVMSPKKSRNESPKTKITEKKSVEEDEIFNPSSGLFDIFFKLEQNRKKKELEMKEDGVELATSQPLDLLTRRLEEKRKASAQMSKNDFNQGIVKKMMSGSELKKEDLKYIQDAKIEVVKMIRVG